MKEFENSPDTTSIGRLGEKFVHQFFEKKYDEGKVVWVNQQKELGKPFDVCVDDGSGRGPLFIEVKTTTDSSKQHFEMSLKELLFAVEKGVRYHVVRVFFERNMEDSTKTSHVSFVEIENLAERLTLKQFKLLVI
eukprot:Lithocolla_globosa_v1_NODE_11386_length_513_cov_1.984716.p1 type:complete len:135 gc:universal NODE_11386_length_513_cov_1.984716:1-405(+)